MRIEEKKILYTDILIIGGGTAGCYAALTIREKSDFSIIIAEKANIKRSGCLAAGVNAINAYILKGRKPEDYVDYAKKDADGIVREDLLLTMSEGLNRVTKKMEQLGLVILKDENGEYGVHRAFVEDVEKALNLEGRHTYLYAPAKGEDIANVVKHLHRAGIVVLLLVSKEQAASIEKKEDTYISSWLEEGTDANGAAKFILKNSAFRDVESRNRDFI